MFLRWLGDADMAGKRLYFFIILILSLALITAGCSKGNSNAITGNSVAADSVTILKDSSCGCCDVYASYLDKKGFDEEFEKHQERSRAGAEQKFKGGLAVDFFKEKTELLNSVKV